MAAMPYADQEKRRKRDQQYYSENAERIKEREREKYRCNKDSIRKRRLDLSPKHRAKNAERERARYAALRAEIISEYGGQCECCGESEPIFLEIDHSNDAGAAHRKKIGRGAKACYAWLKRNSFPKNGFRLLCANCNQGRKRNGGPCPHETNTLFGSNGKSNTGGKKKSN